MGTAPLLCLLLACFGAASCKTSRPTSRIVLNCASSLGTIVFTDHRYEDRDRVLLLDPDSLALDDHSAHPPIRFLPVYESSKGSYSNITLLATQADQDELTCVDQFAIDEDRARVHGISTPSVGTLRLDLVAHSGPLDAQAVPTHQRSIDLHWDGRKFTGGPASSTANDPKPISPPVQESQRPILSEVERRQIHEYCRTAPIESTVGQLLLVGFSDDLDNSRHEAEILLQDLNVGGVFANSYNYRSRLALSQEETLRRAAAIHERVQTLARASNLHFPAFIAVDFEGPSRTPFDAGLICPPSQLALGNTGDVDLVQRIAKIIGFQLRAIGINMLLGPVLDLDGTEQGRPLELIWNRSFSAAEGLASAYGAAYLHGLQDAQILTIGKHFPGFGLIRAQDLEGGVPRFGGRFELFARQLQPFRDLNTELTGLMSAHLQVKIGPAREFVSTSRRLVHDLIRENLPFNMGTEEVVPLHATGILTMTDDLSQMKAAGWYRKSQDKSTPQMAVDAFRAGHDILLFSHLSIDNLPPRGDLPPVTIEDLRQVERALVHEIASSEERKAQFRESLERILLAKATLLKTFDQRQGILFQNSWTIPQVRDLDMIRSPSFLHDTDTTEDPTKAALETVYRKAATMLSTDDTVADDIRLDTSRSTVIVVPDQFAALFKDAFQQFKPISIRSWPRFEPGAIGALTSYAGELARQAEQGGRLIILVSKVDDASVVDALRLRLERTSSPVQDPAKHITLFLHGPPSLLADPVLDSFTVVTTFDGHEAAARSDIAMLKGDWQPKNLASLTVNLGLNRARHDAETVAAPDVSGKRRIHKYVRTNGEETLQTQLDAANKEVNSLSTQLHEARGLLGKWDDAVKQIVRASGWLALVTAVLLGITSLVRVARRTKSGEDSPSGLFDAMMALFKIEGWRGGLLVVIEISLIAWTGISLLGWQERQLVAKIVGLALKMGD